MTGPRYKSNLFLNIVALVSLLVLFFAVAATAVYGLLAPVGAINKGT